MNIHHKKDIAVFGGSFDPIHLGHLHLAELVREEFSLSEIIFMPSGLPAHKELSGQASGKQRYEMVRLATNSNLRFRVSRLELDRAGYTYTVDTLRELRQTLSEDDTLYFIIGADSLVQMHKWKDPEKLFALCQIIAIDRPGVSDEKTEAAISNLTEHYGAKIQMLKMATFPISSTKIRERAGKGLSLKYLITDEVLEYILKHGLYKPSVDRACVLEFLKNNLSEKRYKHSLSVAETAVLLAEIHGVDTDKAHLAGLLHDMAKEFSVNEMYKYLSPDNEVFLYPPIAHSFVGAEAAKVLFGLNDKDIENAIRYHTTARPLMSALEKIIFIADKIETGRSYPETKYLSDLARCDLGKALRAILQITISLAEDGGQKIFPLSIAALKGADTV